MENRGNALKNTIPFAYTLFARFHATMNETDIYDKTERGAQEMRDRALKLSPQLHSVLILVNGVRPVARLTRDAALLGAPTDVLAQLRDQQLIVLISSAAEKSALSFQTKAVTAPSISADEFSQFRGAKDFMNITAVNAAGIRSFFFTLSLEKAGTRKDLAELMPQYEKILKKGFGAAPAEQLCERAQELLA
jgi:hypothetical protein